MLKFSLFFLPVIMFFVQPAIAKPAIDPDVKSVRNQCQQQGTKLGSLITCPFTVRIWHRDQTNPHWLIGFDGNQALVGCAGTDYCKSRGMKNGLRWLPLSEVYFEDLDPAD